MIHYGHYTQKGLSSKIAAMSIFLRHHHLDALRHPLFLSYLKLLAGVEYPKNGTVSGR